MLKPESEHATGYKSAQHEQHTSEKIVLPEEISDQEEISSDQEQEVEQEVNFSPPQAFPSMLMPIIEGPKMDWTVSDNLYNRFLKLKLKCKSILECEFAMLVEKRKCKKEIA